ncbi:MAG: hypothetical protein SP1CHLAM54_17050 [Chlamydiia bacterium]|nr:hypothetical protein [Chlamydiia bacterium]MCH9616593.1 hypothetical protein [Chlamydiia bacterium]MCH9629323.1 hypothetical protein [Chlamydiia bacterium]
MRALLIGMGLLAMSTVNAAFERHPPEAIIINTLPKSGSIYYWMSLGTFFKGTGSLCVHKDPDHGPPYPIAAIAINETNFRTVVDKKFLTQNHLTATPENIAMLKKYGVKKMLLHVRDPRQAVLSWLHHLKKNTIYNKWFDLPDDYIEMEFEDQVDWNIENFFKPAVQFIEDWLDFMETDDELKIHLTTFEVMIQDPVSFIQEALAFYDVDGSEFTTPLKPSSGMHFRKGLVDEWREVMTDEQKELVNSLMPERFFEIFGWER